MAALWPTSAHADMPFVNGLLVEDDHLNQILDNLDDLNVRAGTGNGTALASRIGTVETLVNATGATAAGNTTLSTRLGTGITTSSTATAQFATITTNIGTINTNLGTWSGGTAISRIGALESGLGIPWSGGTALSRIQAIEGRANGSWMAANSTQDIAVDTFGGSSSNDLLYATAVGTPVGLTMSAGTGVVTVSAGHGGWYHISAKFDINVSVVQAHQINLSIQNSANTIAYGADTAYYPSSAWTVNTAHALVLLAPGDTFKANLGAFSTNGADYPDANGGPLSPGGPGTARTHLRAIRVL